MPLERLWPHNGLPDSIVVTVDNNIHQFAVTVIDTELIRDSLMAGGAEGRAEACNRESWVVNLTEVGRWFDLPRQSRGSLRPRWQLLAGLQDG